MQENHTTMRLHIEGMTCPRCEDRIEKALGSLNGVHKVKADSGRGLATLTVDPQRVQPEQLHAKVQSLGYRVGKGGARAKKALGVALVLLAAYMLARHAGLLNLFAMFPRAQEGMGYGMLFVVGLLTSLHCVAMCGGINLSQCLPGEAAEGRSTFGPSLRYNLGRVISYTLVGGLVGAVGSLVTPSGVFRGAVQLIAGAFMILMGLNLLGLLPSLRRFMPRLPGFLARSADRQRARSANRPLVIGLLNGLMPCGPLQAMQLYALSTASPVKGALSMFLFAMGTVPLMFGLGALSRALGRRFTATATLAGAVLVVLLGVSMFGNGLSLSGVGTPLAAETGAAAEAGETVQTVTSTVLPGYYEPITVQAGTPVEWNIVAQEGAINGCNYRMMVPEYGLQHQFDYGDNLLTFLPEEAGTYLITCWMGMIRSTITVTQ